MARSCRSLQPRRGAWTSRRAWTRPRGGATLGCALLRPLVGNLRPLARDGATRAPDRAGRRLVARPPPRDRLPLRVPTRVPDARARVLCRSHCDRARPHAGLFLFPGKTSSSDCWPITTRRTPPREPQPRGKRRRRTLGRRSRHRRTWARRPAPTGWRPTGPRSSRCWSSPVCWLSSSLSRCSSERGWLPLLSW